LGGGGKIIYSLPVGTGSFSDTYIFDFKLGREMPLIIGDPTFKMDYSWSPDGKQIAFSAESPEDNFHIVVVNVESGIMQTIGYSKSCRNIYPSWSPDGKRIVYISDCDGSGGDLHIYIMNSDGTNPIRLTNFDSATPNWSPDGKKIAFSILQGEIKGVYVINSDGRDIRQLTNFGDSPQWSPDGTKIAFMYNGPVDGRNDLGIYIINEDGSNLVNINIGGNTPSWSPDGKLIAISSGPDIIIIDINGEIISSLPATPNVLYPMWSH
jgi:Tol biopolymer transport system component